MKTAGDFRLAALLDKFTELTHFTLNGENCYMERDVAAFFAGRIDGGWPQLTDLHLRHIEYSPPTLPATLRKLELKYAWKWSVLTAVSTSTYCRGVPIPI